MRFLMLNWRDPLNPLAGGAERVTRAYLADLVSRGHEACWFTFGYEGGASEETIDGIRIIRQGGTGSAILAARHWYGQQKPFDLVIDQHHGIPWFAPMWCGTNCVAYIHEVLGPIWNAFYPWPLSSIGQFQERWTHRYFRNTHFFTGSNETKRLLHGHGVREISVVNYGTDVEVLPQLPVKPLKPPYRFAVVSRLAPNKRIDHAIETVVELARRKHDVELTIVGGGEEQERLKALAKRIHVHFTGPLSESDKNGVLRKSHFILHTSQREGWGLNVTEANAMGTPGAVYPVGGLIESTLDEQTGIVSQAETPSSLADRIEGAFQRPTDYQNWRKAGRDRARNLHWGNILPRASEWFEARARGEHVTLESQ